MCVVHTLTNSLRYTLSLFGAVLWVFLLRPPATRSIPCTGTRGNQTHLRSTFEHGSQPLNSSTELSQLYLSTPLEHRLPGLPSRPAFEPCSRGLPFPLISARPQPSDTLAASSHCLPVQAAFSEWPPLLHALPPLAPVLPVRMPLYPCHFYTHVHVEELFLLPVSVNPLLLPLASILPTDSLFYSPYTGTSNTSSPAVLGPRIRRLPALTVRFLALPTASALCLDPFLSHVPTLLLCT